MTVSEVIFSWLGVWGVILGLGMPVAKWILGERSNQEERVVVGFGVGVGVVAAAALGLFLIGVKGDIGLNQEWLLMWGFLGLVVVVRELGLERIGFALYSLKLLCLEAVLPVFAGGLWVWDWQMHYDLTRGFLGQVPLESKFLLARTPLYNLAEAGFLRILGSNFGNFQIVNAVLGGGLVLAVYVIARELVGRRLALMSALFIFFSPWFLHNSWFTWPKMLTVYYLLSGLYFHLKGKWSVAGIMLALGFLTHPLSLFWILGLMAKDLQERKKLKEIARWGVWVVVTVIGWYGWMGKWWGFKELVAASPALAHQVETSVLQLSWVMVKSKILNGVFSVVPFYLFYGKESLIKRLANIYYNPLFGTLTFTGSGWVIWMLMKRGWRWAYQRLKSWGGKLWVMILVFGVLTILAHSGTDRHGVFHNALVPLGPVAVVVLLRLASAKIGWLKAVMGGVMVEGFIGVWLQVWAVSKTAIYAGDLNWQIKTLGGVGFLSDWLGSKVGWFWVVAIATDILVAIAAIKWWRRNYGI